MIRNYLSNRTLSVRIGKNFSTKKNVPSGVPQGSVGGPILFNAYIADIVKFCKTDGVTIKLYADDLKAYHIRSTPDNLNSPLQSFIDKLINYCSLNGLAISEEKCRVMYLGNKNPNSPYYILGKAINCIEKDHFIRDLGLHFSPDLKWTNHIEIVTKKARRISFAIIKSVKTQNIKIFVNLFNVYVRPILEFATNIYNPFLLKDINKIEKVQKDFLRVIYKKCNPKLFVGNPFSPTPTYKELLHMSDLESLEHRRIKSDLILFHKYLHGEVKINCHRPFESRKTNTRGEKYKMFPLTCKTIIRHNSYFIRTSRVYTLLPIDIRQTNVKLFKLRLSNFCFDKFLKCKL